MPTLLCVSVGKINQLNLHIKYANYTLIAVCDLATTGTVCNGQLFEGVGVGTA